MVGLHVTEIQNVLPQAQAASATPPHQEMHAGGSGEAKKHVHTAAGLVVAQFIGNVSPVRQPQAPVMALIVACNVL